VNLSETARLLAAMASFDRRTVGDGDVIAWQAVLVDAPFDDCLEAVKQHYAEHTEWMMPAHVRRAVRDMANQREMAARHTGWAAGQAGVPKDQAHPEVADTVKALEQLPASVLDLVTRVRAMLPEGSREALMPRRVAWEREYAEFGKREKAEPNPFFRPIKERECVETDDGICMTHNRHVSRCAAAQKPQSFYDHTEPEAIVQARELMARRTECRRNGPHDSGMHVDTCPDAVA
jgi:hypothetical protein